MNLSAHTREWVSSVEIERRTARFWIVVVLLEGFLLLAYFALTTAEPTTEVRYLVYPFVWINAGLWAVRRVTPLRGREHIEQSGSSLRSHTCSSFCTFPGRSGSGPQVHQPIFV